MQAFEVEIEDNAVSNPGGNIDNPDFDFDAYEEELKNPKPEISPEYEENKKKLKKKLILNSILPLFIAFIAVITGNQFISNELIKDQSNLIELRVDKTTISFLKSMGESMTSTLMGPFTLQLRMLQKLKNIVLKAEGRDDFNYIEADTGRYDRFFKRNVDTGKIKIHCYSALELVANEEERKKMQRCLLMNDLYSTVKFWDWGKESYVKQFIPKYPSAVIGLESGHAKNIFHNMTKESEIAKMREMHPDLIYDLAIVQSLAPYIADERNIIILTYFI